MLMGFRLRNPNWPGISFFKFLNPLTFKAKRWRLSSGLDLHRSISEKHPKPNYWLSVCERGKNCEEQGREKQGTTKQVFRVSLPSKEYFV